MRPLVAIDWGTSSLRAARLDAQGHVLEERATTQGILSVPPGGFPAVFDVLCASWLDDGVLALMSGMVGSRQGWVEAPYCPCPAGFDELGKRLAWLRPGQLAVVPGLSCEHGGVPDVMRGEEVQVFGALQQLGLREATLVLPGTHSKWVTVQDHRITRFSTFMTGELYALLRQHSILARTLPASDGALDEAAFDQGVDHALGGPSLLATAFSVRTLALFDRRAPEALHSYLSGLVIGEELRARGMGTGPVVVVGSAALATRYERALARCRVVTQRAGAHATWQGLWALAQTLEP